jgi:hypothetical protein
MAYLALNDRENAVNAFREALSRDNDYPAVRQNMERMREMGIDTSVPLTHEVEPNNSLADPNTIAPGRAVDGEIMASMGDIDCYKVTAPPAPRDVLQIEVKPRSRTFTPMVKIFDEERRLLQWIKGGKDLAGQPVSVNLSPAPNSILLLEIEGFADSAGLYTVKVTPLKAFDAYEPNDDIFRAHPVVLGQEIAANIMDKSDTDYYSFETVKDGKVKVTIGNRSTTLIPALATFQPDLRSSGFGPDVRTPGAGLVHTYDVQANQKYFLQVWSQGDTAGDYTLKIEQ